jgi:hypothetical protein
MHLHFSKTFEKKNLIGGNETSWKTEGKVGGFLAGGIAI